MADKPVELVAKDGKTDMTHGRIRAFRPELLDAYKRMLAYQFSGALVLIGFLTVALFISYVFAKQWQPPVLMLVTLAGMLGRSSARWFACTPPISFRSPSSQTRRRTCAAGICSCIR